jgi:hypothetical protein
MTDMNDDIKWMGGECVIEVLRDGPNGPEVIHSQVNKNLIVNVGKKRMWKMTIGTSTKQWRFFRLGKNSAAAGSGDTNVKTALATANIRTVDSKTVDAGRTYKWVVSWPSGAGGISIPVIKECILSDQHTTPGGSILMRTVISPTVAKTLSDKLRITYKARIT